MDRLLKYCEVYHGLAEALKGWKEQINGGLAAGKDPAKFDQRQLSIGLSIEMEHTKDPKMAIEIAMDHLTEDNKYYDKLVEMEENDKV